MSEPRHISSLLAEWLSKNQTKGDTGKHTTDTRHSSDDGPVSHEESLDIDWGN